MRRGGAVHTRHTETPLAPGWRAVASSASGRVAGSAHGRVVGSAHGRVVGGDDGRERQVGAGLVGGGMQGEPLERGDGVDGILVGHIYLPLSNFPSASAEQTMSPRRETTPLTKRLNAGTATPVTSERSQGTSLSQVCRRTPRGGWSRPTSCRRLLNLIPCSWLSLWRPPCAARPGVAQSATFRRCR